MLKSTCIFSSNVKSTSLHKPFVLKIKASPMLIRAVLMPEHHPLAFISMTISPREQAYYVFEKELLAIIFAVKRWHA